VGACLSAAPAAAQAPAAPAAAAAPATSDVGANLNISPKRLTFDVSKRSATVFIFNQGTAPATFDIAVVDRVMLPSGQIMPVAEAQTHPEYKTEVDRQKSAAGMILITPRRAVLAPGKGQTIRVRVAPDAGAEGEYRSHLTVTTVPPRDLGTTADQAASGNPGELRVIINSVFGISIPLIVRLGTPDIRAGIENAKLSYADISPDGVAPAKRTPVVTIDLVRSGANSLFGNVEIHSQTHGGNLIGIAKGVGVYTEIDRRTLRVPLTRAPEQGEVLQATFVDDDSIAGKLLAQATVAP
jgi:P pilus assembly chaperone PapD